MVTTNILRRTFYIRHQHFSGTAFTFERGGTQFLATAAHLFRYVENQHEVDISIMHNNEWLAMHSIVHKHANPNVDIAILTLNEDLSNRLLFRMTIGGILLSADAYFLGFPYGKFMEDTAYLNNNYPTPYIRKGIFSTLPFTKDGVELFYIDGMNNPGFSGGPCVFIAAEDRAAMIPSVGGIVKGYFPHEREVNTPFGPYTFEENSGLVEVHSIRHLSEIQI